MICLTQSECRTITESLRGFLLRWGDSGKFRFITAASLRQRNTYKDIWESGGHYTVPHTVGQGSDRRTWRHRGCGLTVTEVQWTTWFLNFDLLTVDSLAPGCCREEGCSSSNAPRWQSSCSSGQHVGSSSLSHNNQSSKHYQVATEMEYINKSSKIKVRILTLKADF